MSDTPWIVDVTEENFEQAVLVACQERPVLVDFWAPWCGPCRTLGPVLEKLTNERKGKVILAKVNTDEAQALAQHFRISSIPAVKIFYQGALIYEFEGVQPEAALRQLFDQLAPDEDPALSQAKAAETAAPAGAEKQYRTVLEKEPDNADARLGLARALLAQNKPDEIEAILEPLEAFGEVGAEVDRIKAQLFLAHAAAGLPEEAALAKQISADPKDADARLSLGTRLAARGEFETALSALLAAAELNPGLATGKVREAMVKVFYALGSSHPLANEYRGKLARLLY